MSHQREHRSSPGTCVCVYGEETSEPPCVASVCVDLQARSWCGLYSVELQSSEVLRSLMEQSWGI